MPHDAVNEETIRDLVHGFYGKVRVDDLIGPIFNDTIGDEWDRHLATLVDFWCGVMGVNDAYLGNPMAKHMRLKGMRAEFFPRWLALFRETAREQFEPALAETFIERAERIAATIQARTLGQGLETGLGGNSVVTSQPN